MLGLQDSTPFYLKELLHRQPSQGGRSRDGGRGCSCRPREACLPAQGLRKGFPQNSRLKWDLETVQAEGAV